MPDRLSPIDASFLSMEDAWTPMHVGGLAVFTRPAEGFDFSEVRSLIEKRLAHLPRYRQRIASVPGNIARPVWVDDVDFDINYHVRRSALPEPGSDGQLFELVGRLMSRPLDHGRPLWEIYLVEGLAGDRIALISKTHQAVVDGTGTIELGQLILDSMPACPEPVTEQWRPREQPGGAELVADALAEKVQQPGEVVGSARSAARDAAATAGRVLDTVGGMTSALRTVLHPTSPGPLNVEVSGGRVFSVLRTRLEDYRNIRAVHGGDVNDIVLASITGAIRKWLLSREAALSDPTVRALVPFAVADSSAVTDSTAGIVGNRVEPHLVDLPVGQSDPVVRLQQISRAMDEHHATERWVAARSLLRVSGFAPSTLHSLGSRTMGTLSSRIFSLVITNSPGPQKPMYAGRAEMSEMFPITPLARNHALAIGVTSYNGGVYFGFNGDRKAIYDIDAFAAMVEESLSELRGSIG